jgi:hypothetical protein
MSWWHWTEADQNGRPILRHGRPVPPAGEWLEHHGPIKLCKSGLHASPTILHALDYAPGSVLHEVELADIIATDIDKAVGRRRRWLRRADMRLALVEFEESCLLRAAARDATWAGWAAWAASAAWDASASSSSAWAAWAGRAGRAASADTTRATDERAWQEDTLRLWFECLADDGDRKG